MADLLPTSYFAQIALESPALFYKFNEASGTMADSSGNDVHLDVITVAPTYSIASIIPSESTTGIRLTESGNTTFRSTINNPASLSGDVGWSCCFWLRGTEQDTTTQRDYFKFGDYLVVTGGFAPMYLNIRHTGDTSNQLSWVDNNTGYMHNLPSAFYVIVHDKPSNRYSLYMNGILISNATAYSNPPDVADGVVIIGDTQGTNMYIQGLAVIPSVLTAARILELFHSGVAGTTAAPIPV